LLRNANRARHLPHQKPATYYEILKHMTIHIDPATEEKLIKQTEVRDRKRRPKMKVSGASVKKLQRIIIQQARQK